MTTRISRAAEHLEAAARELRAMDVKPLEPARPSDDPDGVGVGWRKIDIENDKPMKGDELLVHGRWEASSAYDEPNQGPNGFSRMALAYRRRIAPEPERELPEGWSERVALGGFATLYLDNFEDPTERCDIAINYGNDHIPTRAAAIALAWAMQRHLDATKGTT